MGQSGFYVHRTADFVSDVLNTETAFHFNVLFLTKLQSWVDESEGHDVCEFFIFTVYSQVGDAFRIVRDIDDGELEIDADLWCCEADAAGVLHGFQHVGDEFIEFGTGFCDGAAFFAEDGIAVLDDREKHAETLN